ncbi:carbohydrate ABC transporter permease [Alkalicella caledoniensis]|uniref:carbohydrate ABC transporter permease n=1 Tax=Alkalicella caledoniensis TaxID=2731377 RepID=UPI001BCD51C6|nr:sugar ABC transporter permease [Alkalicella caledoniensis]
MAKHKQFLYDDIGNEYQRKNLYLLELALLENKIEGADNANKDKLKAELAELTKSKATHPYNQKLREYETKERDFLKALKEKKRAYIKDLKKETDMAYRMKNLKVQLLDAQEKNSFYGKYIELCYDAELSFDESKLKLKHIPEIIATLEQNQRDLAEAIKESSNIDQQKEVKANSEIRKYKEDQKVLLQENKKRLKQKKKQGTISQKAMKNGFSELKTKFKKALAIKKFESPKRANKELIANKKYEIRNGTKRMLNVLYADIADVRRKTPMETKKQSPIFAYLTFLIPGLGQLLNKQYVKAAMFFVASIFIYFAAVPYALGYGNYQGEGIAGLISLAEGGARIHKSLIFMIEGIIALFLSIIAIGLIVVSFNDVLKVEKQKILGIRPKNWFETRSGITQEGFPYLVSFPALFVTVFIVMVPVLTTVLLSFTNMGPQTQSKFTWVGVENYKRIFLGQGLAGSTFWLILFWTVIWTLAATTLAILIGFLLAIIANNERIIGKKFFRTIYLLPWAVPAFITIMFFSIMFSPRGALTQIIENITGISVVVKYSPTLTRLTLIALQGWLGSAYVFLLTTGVLQAIPGDLYEAADMDGASSWQKLRRITIPIVLFQIAPLLVTQYTFNFNNFSIIYLFNGGGPFNPVKYGNLAGSSDLLISYVYKLTIENQYQAIGAAITIFISLGLMTFAFIGFKNSKAFKEERL